jgi:hypothetical protein
VLGPLDETLAHQAAITFDHAVTSDHRFFDRWAVGVQHRELSVIYGIAAYKNTNTCDAFFCVQRGTHQHNLRLSRPLRPNVGDMAVGPLRVEVIEPLRTHRLVVEPNDHSPLRAELEWRAELPAREEHPHFLRRDGRAVQDYVRFDQLGTASGWVVVGDDRVEVDGWFAWRDHSWGVRPGMGGVDPAVPQPSADGSHAGSIFVWMAFRTGSAAGQFQVVETSAGTTEHVDGHVIPDVSRPAEWLPVIAVRHDVAFVDGHTTFSRARLEATTGDGRTWSFDAMPLRPPWAFIGSGYSGGWEDGLGLGVPRGARAESDEYDMSAPADVGFPGGAVSQPWHRETDIVLRLDDQVDGDGHLTVIARPPVPTSTLGRER